MSNLRLVSDSGIDSFPWPSTGEVLSIKDAHYRIWELQEQNEGLKKLTAKQAGENVRLNRRLAEADDASAHPRSSEFEEVVKHWKEACGKTRAKTRSKDKLNLVRARLNEDYTAEELKRAIDVLSEYPFRVYGNRLKEGRAQDRHDQLSDAIGSGEKVEKLLELGPLDERS